MSGEDNDEHCPRDGFSARAALGVGPRTAWLFCRQVRANAAVSDVGTLCALATTLLLDPMRLLRGVVVGLSTGTDGTDAKTSPAAAVATTILDMSIGGFPIAIRSPRCDPLAVLPKSSTAGISKLQHPSASDTAQCSKAAWDALPAPALIMIGTHLPGSSLAAVRLVCKRWAAHLSESLTETVPSAFPMLAHQSSQKDGELACLTAFWQST